jgi:hypothetical protein
MAVVPIKEKGMTLQEKLNTIHKMEGHWSVRNVYVVHYE